MLKYLFIFQFVIINVAQAQQHEVSPDSLNGAVLYTANISLQKKDRGSYIDSLAFNREKSIFYWRLIGKNKNKKNKASPNKVEYDTTFSSPPDTIGRINLYNTINDSLYSRRFFIDKIYLLKEPQPNIQWKITTDSKTIGNFNCTKATAHFRGHQYTAWFSPRIPVPYGPWKLVGLPGLVIQAYDAQKDIYFNAKKLEFTNVGKIGAMPVDGREQTIDLMEYKNILSQLRKKLAKKAQKLIRKYRKKYPNADFQVDIPKPKLMEMFTDSTRH